MEGAQRLQAMLVWAGARMDIGQQMMRSGFHCGCAVEKKTTMASDPVINVEVCAEHQQERYNA